MTISGFITRRKIIARDDNAGDAPREPNCNLEPLTDRAAQLCARDAERRIVA